MAQTTAPLELRRDVLTASVIIRSDQTATCRELFNLSGVGETDLQGKRLFIVRDLPRSVNQSTILVGIGRSDTNQSVLSAIKMLTLLSGNSVSTGQDYLHALLGGLENQDKLEIETVPAGDTHGAAQPTKTSGSLLHIDESEAILAGEKGDIHIVALGNNLSRMRIKAAGPSILPRPVGWSNALIETNQDLVKPRLSMTYQLLRGSLTYRVVHIVGLAKEDATSMDWSTDVIIHNASLQAYGGKIEIVERKADTRQPINQQEQTFSLRERKSKSKRRDMPDAASAPPTVFAQPGPVPDNDRAGITDLEMRYMLKTEGSLPGLVATTDGESRITLRQALSVPCKLIFQHRFSDQSSYERYGNDFSGTEQFLEWIPAQLANGEFLFTGHTRVLSANGTELGARSGPIWFDAWRNPERHALNLGMSERVLVKRVSMEERVNEKTAERVQRYRAEITNQSRVSVQVQLVEKVSELARKPTVIAVFQCVFADGIEPVAESTLLSVRDGDRTGWTRDAAQSAGTFSQYVDRYTDVNERVVLPYDRVITLTVPAGSATNLNRPGKLVMFYEISSVYVRG